MQFIKDAIYCLGKAIMEAVGAGLIVGSFVVMAWAVFNMPSHL
mgnify:CR=1 FL=1